MNTGRSRTERGGGRYTRENAGISSEREARNLPVESLRFPGEGSSAQGKPGAKARPKGVVDAHTVEIPAFSLLTSPPLLTLRLHPNENAPLPSINTA